MGLWSRMAAMRSCFALAAADEGESHEEDAADKDPVEDALVTRDHCGGAPGGGAVGGLRRMGAGVCAGVAAPGSMGTSTGGVTGLGVWLADGWGLGMRAGCGFGGLRGGGDGFGVTAPEDHGVGDGVGDALLVGGVGGGGLGLGAEGGELERDGGAGHGVDGTDGGAANDQGNANAVDGGGKIAGEAEGVGERGGLGGVPGDDWAYVGGHVGGERVGQASDEV